MKLSKAEGNKVIKLCIGPFRVKDTLKKVGYISESEVGRKVARYHANRLRRIGIEVADTENRVDGIFLDSLRMEKKISREKEKRNEKTEGFERHL